MQDLSAKYAKKSPFAWRTALSKHSIQEWTLFGLFNYLFPYIFALTLIGSPNRLIKPAASA